MKNQFSFLSLSLILCWNSVIVAEGGKCHINLDSCDEWSPCCNTSGWCGAGYGFCGATCFEKGNHGEVKCLPKPTCKPGPLTINSKQIAKHQGFKGDFRKYDFTVEGDHDIVDDVIRLKLSKPGTGTTLYSTRFINFGRIGADMKMDRTNGVVTSLITMSNIKDEIDFEWVGNRPNQVESNWFYQGIIPDYKFTDGKVHSQPDSTQWHRYELDWTPDTITWLVDGNPIRTQLRQNSSRFPTTPARFSFGIWDASSGPAGTREWAGGYVDWNSMHDFFSVSIRNVTIQCYGPDTSHDTDFEMDDKFGLILRGEPPRVPLDPNHPPRDDDEHPDQSNGNHFHIVPLPSSSSLPISSSMPLLFTLLLALLTFSLH